jgi:hypothetical protein
MHGQQNRSRAWMRLCPRWADETLHGRGLRCAQVRCGGSCRRAHEASELASCAGRGERGPLAHRSTRGVRSALQRLIAAARVGAAEAWGPFVREALSRGCGAESNYGLQLTKARSSWATRRRTRPRDAVVKSEGRRGAAAEEPGRLGGGPSQLKPNPLGGRRDADDSRTHKSRTDAVRHPARHLPNL